MNGMPNSDALDSDSSSSTELSDQDLSAITTNWEQTSTRKTELIEKKIRKEANDDELKELARLKMLTEARGELFAPLPLPHLATIKARLQSKGQ